MDEIIPLQTPISPRIFGISKHVIAYFVRPSLLYLKNKKNHDVNF